MKRMKRTLSLLLALAMLWTLLPELTLPARAEDETDLTIDFDYEKKNNVKSREDALLVTAEAQFHDHDKEHPSQPITSLSDLKNRYGEFYWQKATIWTVKDKDTRSLRKLLTSTDDKDKYIVLNQDDDHDYYKSDLWQTIEITTDKVLDLNGRQIKIRYDSNRSNDDPDQTDHNEYHNCTAFRILKGATLTIIDSSAWRGENGGKGHGMISFTGYRVNPFSYPINTYTTRDLFDISDGNLVIYGGTFQAGSSKTFYKSKFTWDRLRTTIGTALELGVNIAEYATGIDAATSSYRDLLQAEKSTDLDKDYEDSGTEDDGTDGPNTTIKKDGTDAPEEDQKDSPTGAKNHNKSLDEKQEGKNDGENKANAKKTGKNDKNTKLAEGRKKIVESAVNKEGIDGMVGKVFQLGKNIADMIGKDKGSFCVESIMGTVVKVGNGSSFISYGGTYEGYGSTPNTRNAVVEVNYNPGIVCPFDSSKVQGGYVYIFDGTFEGYTGANVFNFVRSAPGTQYGSQIIVGENAEHPTQVVDGKTVDVKSPVALSETETGGVEVYYYDNQDKAGEPGFEPKLVNTANVQVRGGVFRNHYELQNVAIRAGSSENFNKFPGTNGSVNLGIESFGEDLIRDGRIQIVDKYRDGALVLLDKQSAERKAAQEANQPFTEGLYRYRLLCGDTELRAKSYLQVYPNPAKTNAAKSMILASYGGQGEAVSKLWVDDKDNERAPLAQTENYFDFILNRDDTGNFSILPMFHDPNSTDPKYPEFSAWTTNLGNSEFWYYPTPMVKTPKQNKMIPLPKVPYGDAWYVGTDKQYEQYGWTTKYNQHTCKDTYTFEWYHSYPPYDYYWDWGGSDDWNEKTDTLKDVTYHFYKHDDLKTTQRYFTYKVYRVDPLTRENLVESNVYGEDSPLITVRYGSSDDSLKCKLPLLEVEQQIKNRQKDENVPEERRWKGFQPGEMYRVTLTVEEDITFGYKSDIVYQPKTFGGQLDTATTESSILFRCVDKKELTAENPTDPLLKPDFTPLQWESNVEVGSRSTIRLINGKAGMTDYKHDNKVFDVYYQWWETDADGNPLKNGLFAGTDNVYEGNQANRSNHHPSQFRPGIDGKTYVNTVDPNDPYASYYTYHGLPGTADGAPLNENWSAEDLHMYTAQTVNSYQLTLGAGHLTPKNNDVYHNNFDTCYIPAELEGKYIRVCAIAVNPEWSEYFDKKQTFWSHVMKVSPEKKLEGEVKLNYDGTVLFGTELKATLSGMVATFPASAVKYQWQSCLASTSDYQDVPGATGATFVVPTDPGHRKIKVRVKVMVDGYRKAMFSPMIYGDELYPLQVDKPVFPEMDVNTTEAIDLAPYVSGGSGNFVMFYDSGPEWAYISGYWLMATNPDKRGTFTANVRVLDITTGEEKTVSIKITVKKPLTGDLIINGIPQYNGNPTSPNVLRAEVVGGNGELYWYQWFREDELILFGYNDSYPIRKEDAGKRIYVVVHDPTNPGGEWTNNVAILPMNAPAAPKVEAGAPSNETDDNGYVNVISGTYPLEISPSSNFSTVYKTIYSGNFTFIPSGVWYVRSIMHDGMATPPYTEVVVPSHSEYIHFKPVDPVPYGTYRGSDDGQFCVKLEVEGGKLPLTIQDYYDPIKVTFLSYYGDVVADAHLSYDFEAAGTDNWRECRFLELTGNFPDTWAYRGYAYVGAKDADGNKCWIEINFEGCRADPVSFFVPDFRDVTFHDMPVGYEPITYYDGPVTSVSFQNKEYVQCSALSFTLGGPDADYFDICSTLDFLPPDSMIKPGKNISVFVTPKGSLPVGTYKPEFYMHNSNIESEYWWTEHGTVTFNVVPIGIDKCTVSVPAGLVYNGQSQKPDIIVKSPDGIPLTEGVDYEVEFTDNVGVGEASYTVTGIGSVTGSLSGTFSIGKASAGARTKDVYVRCDVTERQQYPLAELLPKGYGTVDGFSFSRAADDHGTIVKVGRDLDTGTLYFDPSGTAEPGDTAALKGAAAVTNYEAVRYNVIVHFTDKDVPAVQTENLEVAYTGEPVSASRISGTASFGSEILRGTWSFAEPESPLLRNVHEAQEVPVIFTPNDTERFKAANASLKLTIKKAEISGGPAFTKITEAGKTLADTDLTIVGGTFPVPGVVYYELPDETEVEFGKAYTWYFVPTSTNYESLSGTVIPWRDNETSVVDKSELDSAVEVADKAVKSKYTPESVAKLEAAVAAAKALQDDKAATQAQVDAAAQAVRDAVMTLVPRDGPANPFADVAEGAYYYDPVLWAVNHSPQITNGTSPDRFSPDRTCTRAQVVTFLWRAMGQPEPSSSVNPFTDVAEGQYYYKAVLWAVEKGVTNGTSPDRFSPDRGCTRAQVVTFLWRAEGQPEPMSAVNPFMDVPEGQYYTKPVLWAVEKSITKGTSADKFSPDSTCTRGQIVTFLYRDMK